MHKYFKKNKLILTLIGVFISFASYSQRVEISFNDGWAFKKTEATANQAWEKVKIPHTWNATDMQNTKDFYEGEGQYQKQVTWSNEYRDKRLFLRFEGVGQVADVFVNDKLVGTHKGGYSAFCFEITYAIQFDKPNTILVKANNKARKDIIPINHFLFGIYGGIYRPVSLIVTPKINISTTDYASSGVYISQKEVSAAKASISIAAKLENVDKLAQQIIFRTTIFDKNGKLVAEKSTNQLLSTQGRQQVINDLEIDKPHLWQGQEDPYLYKVSTQILVNGKVWDEVMQPLGIRKFELIAGKGMFLNGKAFAMQGVCRHQDWLGMGSALTNQEHDQDLSIIEEMGATTIRFAHYQQSSHIYSKCDSMGFAVWAEIPFVNAYSGLEGENAKQQLEELIKQNYNHPSIYVWGLHNEVYGKSPADFPAVLTQQLNDLAKTLDPYRYTVAVSGYGEMERPTNLKADIQGMNRYYGWYEGKIGDLAKWASGLALKYPDNLVMLSEYGADANILQQQEQATLKESWNYTLPQYPENFATKTHEIQWPIIKQNPIILASYVWNTFDFATPMWNRGSMPARNMKGLVSFDRKVKKDGFYWYKANWSKNPVVYITERRTTTRKIPVTPVTVYSNRGIPVLYLNGKKIQETPQTVDVPVHFVFKNIVLKKGKNTIKVQVNDGHTTITDTVTWNYNPQVNEVR